MSKLEDHEVQVDNYQVDRSNGLPKPLIPYRYFIMFLMFLATGMMSAGRTIINVALIPMVNNTRASNFTIIHRQSMAEGFKVHQQFDWNQHEQGIILGSYYYTYTAAQIFAGLLADKFNIVHLMTIVQIIATFCMLATPIAASYSIYSLIAVRSVMGLAHVVIWPCLYCLIEYWFPPTELGFTQGLGAVGYNAGAALSAIFTAWISTKTFWGGWPAAFYFTGIANFIFALIWSAMVTINPASNRLVSNYEKQLLNKIVENKKTERKKVNSIPFTKILTSLPLWSVIVAKGMIGLAHSVMGDKISVYLDAVLGYKLENNGLVSGLIYVGSGITQLTCGPLSKYIIAKGWMSKTVTRKIFETIALGGITVSLMAICYLEDPSLIVVCLVVSMAFYGFALGGDVPIVPEMAPDLVGTAFGFANCFGSAAGFVGPVMVAFILGDDAGSKSNWILTFQTTAALQFIAIVIFDIFANAEPQTWGKVKQLR